MTRLLIRQDLHLLAREKTLAPVLLITLVAVFYAIYSASQWKAELLESYSSAVQSQSSQTQNQRQQIVDLQSGALTISQAPSAGLPNMVSFEYQRKPGLMTEFSVGDSDLRPTSASIKAMGRADDLFRFYQVDNPSMLALGRFDLAFVVIYLLPLLIMGMTYNVLSADKESGALQILLSQPVSAARVAWTRITLRTSLITAVAIVGSLSLIHISEPTRPY